VTLRIFIAVTHLLGAGHLTRAAALARAFAGAGHETTLVSGGMPSALIAGAGFEFVQLPPVRTAGSDFRALLDEAGHAIATERLARRRTMLLEAFRAAKPDVVITELFPFGRRVLAKEFIALLEEAHRRKPRPLVVSSARDILVAPAKPERVAETHERLSTFYDAVLVHADPRVAPIELSWPVDTAIEPMIRYTGYVDEGPPSAKHERPRSGVVVSGGSSAASLPLYRAALKAARLASGMRWRILVGAGVDERSFETLRATAPGNASVERARSDFRVLLARAAVSVSQAGYNTAVDVLRTGAAAVLVPFEGGRETEQRLRAERLAALGLAQVLLESELSAENLKAAVASRRVPSSADIKFDGARETVALVERLAQGRAPSVWRAAWEWGPLDDVLRRTADAGQTVAYWWRDDDVVAYTPALDRLLEVARRFDLSIALAAIPAGLERSLTERLGDEPQAHIVVHGFSHRNHAPPGQKKAEFGPHRPLEILSHDAASGLQRARKAVGEKLLRVFVPPWNRVVPELLPLLAQLGYRGFSSFSARNGRGAPSGLARIDAHIDPIDWAGSRCFLPGEAIVARLASAVAARLDGAADPEEPIGLLTHHLIHDEAGWRFLEALLGRLRSYDRLIFPSPRALFR
jgi:predicted glycosyltransferase